MFLKVMQTIFRGIYRKLQQAWCPILRKTRLIRIYHVLLNTCLKLISFIQFIKSWPNGLATPRMSTRVCETRTCVVRTCVAKRISKWVRKSQKAGNCTHIQMTCDQLVSTCVGWPIGEKLASTWVRI